MIQVGIGKKVEKDSVFYLALTVLLALGAMLLLLRMYVFGGCLFLSRGVMSDLVRVNLPTYIELYDRIIGDGYFWSWRMGIGTSVFSHADIVMDPFTYIVFLRGREHIADMFVWLYAVKAICTAVTCYLYLNHFRFRKPVSVLCAELYMMSGILIFSINFALGTICVYCPLYLLGCELLLEKRKLWPLFLSLLATCLYSYYFFYISGILCALYLTARLLMTGRRGPRIILAHLLLLLGMGVLCACLSAVQILPQLELAASSARTNDGKDAVLSWKLFVPHPEYIFTVITRMFQLNALGDSITQPYYGSLFDCYQFATYISCASVPLFVQFLAGAEAKQRRLFILSAAALVLLISLPAFAFLTNAFSTVNFRWMFIVQVFLALGCALGMQTVVERGGFYRLPLYFSLLGSCLLFGVSKAYFESLRGVQFLGTVSFGKTLFAVYGATLLLHTCCVWKRGKLFEKRWAGALAFCAVFAVVLYEADVNYRTWFQNEPLLWGYRSGDAIYNDASEAAIQYLRETDQSFYRIEKQFDSVMDNNSIPSDNDAMAQDYYGLKNYSGYVNAEYEGFLLNAGLFCACMPGAADYQRTYDSAQYGESVLTPLDIIGQQLNYINGVYDHYGLMSYLGVKYYVAQGEADLPRYFAHLKTVGGCKIYVNKAQFPLAFTVPAVVSEECYASLLPRERERTLLHAAVVEKGGSQDAPALTQRIEKLAEKKREAFSLDSFRPDSISFSLRVDTDARYLVLTMPYDKDWHIMIDGVEASAERVNNGLLGVSLAPEQTGRTLRIRLDYKPLTFYKGLAVSGGAVIALAATVFYIRRKKAAAWTALIESALCGTGVSASACEKGENL